MTPTQSLIALTSGLLCFVAGVTWWLGPVALAACGLALAAAALLAPHREPTEAEIAEAVRKALEGQG